MPLGNADIEEGCRCPLGLLSCTRASVMTLARMLRIRCRDIALIRYFRGEPAGVVAIIVVVEAEIELT